MHRVGCRSERAMRMSFHPRMRIFRSEKQQLRTSGTVALGFRRSLALLASPPEPCGDSKWERSPNPVIDGANTSCARTSLVGPSRRGPRRSQLWRNGHHRRGRPSDGPSGQTRLPRCCQPEERTVSRRRGRTGYRWKCFEQKLALRNEAEYAKIPQYHIICSSTFATRDRELMDAAETAGRLWQIDTGHDLMITEPQKVAAALLAVSAD
jgi:hypothetical protein